MMQSGFRDAWKPLLDTLMESDQPMALHEVADAVGVSRPTALRHLDNMRDGGLVAVEGARRNARYFPREHLWVEWTQRTRPGMRQQEGWQRHTWSCDGAIDWRFPLVSRVPDELARQTLWRFFAEAHARGYLTPWLLPLAQDDPYPDHRKKSLQRQRYLRNLQDPRDSHGWTFCVYGSTARGDARPGSDIDLMLIGPSEHPDLDVPFITEVPFEDLAADMSLGSPRPIQFSSFTLDQFDGLGSWFRKDMLQHAITVYTSKPGGDFIEAWRREE